MESQKGGLFIETILKTIHFRQWVSWSATPKLKRSTLQQNKVWRILVTIIACRVEDISTTVAVHEHWIFSVHLQNIGLQHILRKTLQNEPILKLILYVYALWV